MSPATRMSRVRCGRRCAALTLATALGILGTNGCTAKHPAPALATPAPAGLARPPAPVRKAVADDHAPARTHAIATIGRRSIGPFEARAGESGLVAWVIGSASAPGQDLRVVPLGPDGAPLAAPAVVATLADGVTSLVVRPAGGPRGGWLVAWSALMDRGEALSVLSLDPAGKLRGGPAEIQRTGDHIAWLDFVPLPAGTVCAWAEETSSGPANLLTVGIDSSGKATGQPARVARDIVRWQVARGPSGAGGAGLALVDLPESSTAVPGPGRLLWEVLDGDGHPSAPPVPIGSAPTVSSDVEVVPTPGGWLLGWTDRTSADAQVTLARIDASGRIAGPSQPLQAAGSSSLVALASGPAGSLVAWESPRAASHPTRELRLTGLARDGAAPSPASLSVQIASGTAPELVATGTGFALLAVAHACLAGPAPGPCAGPLAPTLVRMGPSLEPVQSEPVLLGDDRAPAAIAWGLRCVGDRCSALAANGDAPTTVFTVDFEPRSSPFAAPTVPPPPGDAPRLTGLQTIAAGPVFADVATARLGSDTLLATLALPRADEPAEPGRKPSGAATISLAVVDPSGRTVGPPVVVSSRAVASGGLAIAAAARPEDGAAIAWVKRDGGDPQVHLARFDRRGKRLREVQLTSARGDASSVALAAVDGGWLVAWVDGRDGDGEVYAARVDSRLDRTSREERITRAPGDATDVALATAPGDLSSVWLAWSDPRESPSEGLGDIYVTQLYAKDARRAGDEMRVLTTAHHSRSPQIVPWAEGSGAEGALIAWIEDGPAGLEAPATLMVAHLDRTGRRAGGATSLPLPPGSTPTAVALSLEEGARPVARVVVARSSGAAVTVDALRMAPDGAVVGSPAALLDLEAEPPFDVALALSGDAVFFDDTGSAEGQHRVRRAVVDWRR